MRCPDGRGEAMPNKRLKFRFQFCPQGFRLAAPHGTLTRGGPELNSRRQILSQGPSNFLQVMLNHCLNLAADCVGIVCVGVMSDDPEVI